MRGEGTTMSHYLAKAARTSILESGQYAAFPVVAALLLTAFIGKSSAQGTYEYQSADVGGVLARMELAALPVETLETITSVTLLDPMDPDYSWSVPQHSLIALTGRIRDDGFGGLANDREIVIVSASISPSQAPSWMSENAVSVLNRFDMSTIATGDWIHTTPGQYFSGDWVRVPEPRTNLLIITAILSGMIGRRRIGR